ncbi:MAG: hypothetical protein IJ827_03730, partial [Lachnospiraceae bacterium]|nr:hypothetical protein [Lachnospiraceae bacterium]
KSFKFKLSSNCDRPNSSSALSVYNISFNTCKICPKLSVATIFAWSGALRKRGELDKLPELCDYADKLEQATLSTIEEGFMTKDLVALTTMKDVTVCNTRDFILKIKERLAGMCA